MNNNTTIDIDIFKELKDEFDYQIMLKQAELNSLKNKLASKDLEIQELNKIINSISDNCQKSQDNLAEYIVTNKSYTNNLEIELQKYQDQSTLIKSLTKENNDLKHKLEEYTKIITTLKLK